jgi:fatty acid desaturase
MDNPTNVPDERDDTDMRALWTEAAWGAGLIGAVLAIVALVGSVATP